MSAARLAPEFRATLLCALILSVAPAAHAQEVSRLNLAWDHCRAGGGTTTTVFDCSSNAGRPYVLVASVIPPTDLPRLAGASVSILAYLEGTSVPLWWQTRFGQCRVNAIDMSFDPYHLLDLGCPDIWQSATTFSGFEIQQSSGHPSTLWLLGSASLAEGDWVSVTADGTELTVARIVISRTKSTGATACAGCASVVCLALVEARLFQLAGYGDSWIPWEFYSESEAYANVSFGSSLQQFDVQSPCNDGLTATRNRTWGSIKSLYR